MRNFNTCRLVLAIWVILGCRTSQVIPSAIAQTASQYGKELKIAKDAASGKLHFGAVFTLADDPDGLSLLLNFRTDISNEELQSLPDNLHWNIMGHRREIAVPLTSPSSKVEKSILRTGQIGVSHHYTQSRAILSLKDGLLLFGATPETSVSGALYHINLGELCKTSPELFTNLSNDKTCAEILESDVDFF